MGWNLNIQPPWEPNKKPRTKIDLCFGTNSKESAVPPKLFLLRRNLSCVPTYASQDNGRVPVRHYGFQGKRSSCPPKSIHAEAVPPFHRRQLSLSALYTLLFFVLGFDGCIIAQLFRLVKAFLQFSLSLPAFSSSPPQKARADPKAGSCRMITCCRSPPHKGRTDGRR